MKLPDKTEKFQFDPDEILLDARNLPRFDESRFEGRVELPITKKTFWVLGSIILALVLIYLGRVGFLQIVEGQALARVSEENRLHHSVIFGRRGIIFDRRGEQLASNDLGRSYSRRAGLAHVLGFLGYPTSLELESGLAEYPEELIGKDGVERSYNEIIKGKVGIKIQEFDVKGQLISESTQQLPVAGRDLVLTVDAALTEKLYRAIERLALQRGFAAGAGVILDLTDGAVLALTSFPEYSLALLSSTSTSRAELEALFTDPRTPFVNRATAGLYAPGSIIKPFIALGALSEGVITTEKELLSTGSISIPNPYQPGEESVFLDWRAHGLVDMERAIALSSNVYFYQIGGGYQEQRGIGIEGIARFARMFGLEDLSGIDLAVESVGQVPTPEWKELNFPGDPWRLGDTYNTAIGQYGFQVTPLQVARAYGAVATAGRLPTPYLYQPSREPRQEIIGIRDEDYQVIVSGMRQAVLFGTAAPLNLPFVEIAAKTGTAELGETKQRVNSWAAGFFPYQNPKYVFAAVMEKGSRANTVGAAFVMKEVLEWLALYRPEYLDY